MCPPFSDPNKRLEVRQARRSDIPAIITLSRRVYAGTGMYGYSEGPLTGQMNNFPEGQFVAVVGEQVVGYCATFRIAGEVALKPHDWTSVTGNGYASRHDPQGDWLYGMEVCVDPDYRGYRIGQRLYNERKSLCQALELQGVVFAGRLPSLRRKIRRYDSVEAYVEAIRSKKERDDVLSFQLHNEFEIHGILPHYLDADHDSMGYGIHLIWRNPAVTPNGERGRQKLYGKRMPDTVRVGTVQYQQRPVASFEAFSDIVTYFVDVVATYKGDFVVFPELFTLQLLSIERRRESAAAAIEAMTDYAGAYRELMRDLALRYNINIVGGSTPVKAADDTIRNMAYVFLRDGQVFEQPKIHPTPNEAYWWNITGGRRVSAIETDCGPIGVLVCYDAEFPELARHLVDQGIQILFVPFCTDERQSYLRVRYCGQARAVENQLYVVLSGNVGNLPNVPNMELQYGQSCILTPCDFPFDRDGIAADTTPNVETVAFADLRPKVLLTARNSGTVKNLHDRRHELYSVNWRGD
ncbi:bifunctional GNAT family N-acetyltransferase/carbon-nitrogen hydrolase family protein [Marinobacter bohaiensis]|uniref:bifunctional GNAT family N-acetyltransferase/carbon-nitrogen hydrolase family protein n=1 Tax=Marinobacter bohaiensis TaxID=2201898 RepID=UPI000DAC7169|nr:bifunctional GNAT family N-acetyltransferase/carbon-nitrogen hydrolase family protein [Marinobacter bohaiensis]